MEGGAGGSGLLAGPSAPPLAPLSLGPPLRGKQLWKSRAPVPWDLATTKTRPPFLVVAKMMVTRSRGGRQDLRKASRLKSDPTLRDGRLLAKSSMAFQIRSIETITPVPAQSALLAPTTRIANVRAQALRASPPAIGNEWPHARLVEPIMAKNPTGGMRNTPREKHQFPSTPREDVNRNGAKIEGGRY